MTEYVKVINEEVIPVTITKPYALVGYEEQGIQIIDITDMELKPKEGWTYSEDKFHMPLLTHALIEDNKVIQISTLNEIDAWAKINDGEEWINIEGRVPQPEVGWNFIGDDFSAPE